MNKDDIRKNTLQYIQNKIQGGSVGFQAILIMGLIDNYILQFTMSQARKLNSRTKALVIFFGISFLIIASHATIFTLQKEENLFQAFHVSRVVDQNRLDSMWEQLKEEHLRGIREAQTDNQQIQFQYSYHFYQEVYEILKNPQRKEFYDQANDISANYRYAQDPVLVLQLMISPAISYLIMVLSSLSGKTQREKQQNTQKWIVLSMISLFLLEFVSLLRYTDQSTFSDYFLPFLTFYEKREIMKFCMNPIVVTIRFYFDIFVQSEYDITLTIMEGISTNNQFFLNQLEPLYQLILQKEDNFLKLQNDKLEGGNYENKNQSLQSNELNGLTKDESNIKKIYETWRDSKNLLLSTKKRFAMFNSSQLQNKLLLNKAVQHLDNGELPTDIERQLKELQEKDQKKTSKSIFSINNLFLLFFIYSLFKSGVDSQ